MNITFFVLPHSKNKDLEFLRLDFHMGKMIHKSTVKITQQLITDANEDLGIK